MNPNYISIFIFLFLSLIFGLFLILMGFFFGKKNYYKDKNSPYECGFDPFGSSRFPFNIKYYLVAILFIIFDIETAFLFPWAIKMKKLPIIGIISMVIFLLLLIVGFIYEWKKGALNWE